MNRSPIQLLETSLLKLAVEPVQDERFKNRVPSNPFEYEKITLETARACTKFPEYWEDSVPPHEGIVEKTYYVQLGLRTPVNGEEVGPYKFEVVCSGIIGLMPNRTPGTVSDDDLAVQFGLTLLYGVIREHLSNLTYKMTWGQVLLPTMTFLDESFDRPEAIRTAVLSADVPNQPKSAPRLK